MIEWDREIEEEWKIKMRIDEIKNKWERGIEEKSRGIENKSKKE